MVKEKGLKWTLQVTYEKWRYKSNPKYPSAHKVIKIFLCDVIASCINQILKNYKWNSCFKSLAASNYLGAIPINKTYVSQFLAHRKVYQSEHQEKIVTMNF